jgi:hypothetical protein
MKKRDLVFKIPFESLRSLSLNKLVVIMVNDIIQPTALHYISIYDYSTRYDNGEVEISNIDYEIYTNPTLENRLLTQGIEEVNGE